MMWQQEGVQLSKQTTKWNWQLHVPARWYLRQVDWGFYGVLSKFSSIGPALWWTQLSPCYSAATYSGNRKPADTEKITTDWFWFYNIISEKEHACYNWAKSQITTTNVANLEWKFKKMKNFLQALICDYRVWENILLHT